MLFYQAKNLIRSVRALFQKLIGLEEDDTTEEHLHSDWPLKMMRVFVGTCPLSTKTYILLAKEHAPDMWLVIKPLQKQTAQQRSIIRYIYNLSSHKSVNAMIMKYIGLCRLCLKAPIFYFILPSGIFSHFYSQIVVYDDSTKENSRTAE